MGKSAKRRRTAEPSVDVQPATSSSSFRLESEKNESKISKASSTTSKRDSRGAIVPNQKIIPALKQAVQNGDLVKRLSVPEVAKLRNHSFEKLHFVLDTNYLFQDVDLECRLYTYKGIPDMTEYSRTQGPQILIPYVVIDELDKKKTGSKQARLAHITLEKILGDLRSSEDDKVAKTSVNGQIIIQSKAEHRELRREMGHCSNDELILRTAEVLYKKAEKAAKQQGARHGPVVLLTDDRNLKIRPSSVPISRISFADLRKYRDVQGTSEPPAVTVPFASSDADLPFDRAQEILGFLGNNALVAYFGPIVKAALMKAYTDVFEDICLRRFPEPWSPSEVLSAYSHFSFSVFQVDGWPRNTDKLVKDALSKLKHFQAVSDSGLTRRDILEFIQLLTKVGKLVPLKIADDETKINASKFLGALEEAERMAENRGNVAVAEQDVEMMDID